MPHKQFTRGRGRLGSKRVSTWLSIDPLVLTLSASASISHIMTTVELAKRPFTLVRTHLEMFIFSDQEIAGENQIGAVGLCVVSDQAVGVGVTAVPTPITDLDSDLWFAHQILLSSFQFLDATGISAPAGSAYTMDSKAMRKVNDDQQIIIVQENSTAGLGQTTLVAGRMMIKEA